MRRYYPAAALVLVIGVVALVAVLVSRDESGTPTDGPSSATTSTTSFPYDFVEAAADIDVETLQGAKFASLTLVTEGGLESYLLAADSPGFAALTQALAEAEEGAHEAAPGEPAPGEAAGSTVPAGGDAVIPGVTASTLTYVMDDRSTYTLVIDTDEGILYRGGQEWRPKTDLAALVEAATDAAP